MTFLPVVDRELRVAARRKSTYRLRAWTAVVALGTGFLWSWMGLLARGPSGYGKILYTALTGFVFALCLLSGVLLTADCLSAEKREGTLGLLFLTDLKGYDVVLGKLLATGLNAFYGLLAVVPITGLCLLLGGLTGGEFWRMNLALVNALFFSLALGLCVSAFGRESQRVMGNTLGLVVLFAAVLPALGQFDSLLGLPAGWSGITWISPFTSFRSALEPQYTGYPNRYWWSLAASQAVSWLLLAGASVALPHRWQEGADGSAGIWSRRGGSRGRAAVAARARLRDKLLPVNPVLWLAGSERGVRFRAWLIVGGWGVLVLMALLLGPSQGGLPAYGLAPFGPYGAGPFGFLLKWLLAAQACRFFVEARRSGALEMLLCTPLTTRDLIGGQVLALRRSFQWPVITLLLLLLLPSIRELAVPSHWGSPSAVEGVSGLAFGGLYCLRMLADCYALGAFGIWMALTYRKPAHAPTLTVLLVLILPSILCWLDLFADLFFILWGTIRLRQMDLRSLAAAQYQPDGFASGGKPAIPEEPPLAR